MYACACTFRSMYLNEFDFVFTFKAYKPFLMYRNVNLTLIHCSMVHKDFLFQNTVYGMRLMLQCRQDTEFGS